MTGEILFLAHRVPFPPDRGDKIRSHHILNALARLAPVHVGTLGETDSDMAHVGELERIAASHCLVRRKTSLVLPGLEALASRRPVSLTAFHDATLARWVRQLCQRRPIGAIYVFSGQMGQYVPDGFAGRVVTDLVDVDSLKFEAYADDAFFPKSMLYRREARLLAREEARLVNRSHATLLVSEAEADLLRGRVTAGAPIRALGNGIDTAVFDPDRTTPHWQLAGSHGPHLVFTGQMDYLPNIAAARRAIQNILPTIRAAHPGATLHIVGRAPTAELLACNGRDDVRVWGEVPDMRPFLAAADLVLVPLLLARGVQNKVLEAMAMARPVLASEGAGTGIDALPGRDLEVASDDADFVAKALALLDNTERALNLGQAARRFVQEHSSWDAQLSPLASIMGFATSAEEGRDAA